MEKLCRKCKCIKKASEFTSRKDSKDGLHSYCRECIRKLMNKVYKSNPQKVKDSSKQREAVLRIMINEIKTKNGCVFCSEREPVALDFHHLDPTTKDKCVSDLLKLKNRKRILKEIGKCVSICATHHRKLEANIISLPPKTMPVDISQL